ncbi:MAG: hypothetical protein K6L81_17440 [Agarilytica sp.]
MESERYEVYRTFRPKRKDAENTSLHAFQCSSQLATARITGIQNDIYSSIRIFSEENIAVTPNKYVGFISQKVIQQTLEKTPN